MNQEDLIIHKLFAQAVSKFPQKIALQIKMDNRWQGLTYKDLETKALKVCTFLFKEGFKKGDFAVLVAENRPEWTVIYLGIMYAGLVCVPLDPQLSQQDLKNFIFDCGAKIIFCSYNIFTKNISQDIRERLGKVVVLDAPKLEPKNWVNFSDLESIIPEENNFPLIQSEDIASLIYTSGTTGKPKGVLLTHRNICANFISIAKLNICFPSDNFLSILPLHHTYPFMVTLIVPLLTGAQITYCPSDFKPQMLAQIIKEAEVTILVSVPQLLSLLHRTIWDRIKKIPFFLQPLTLPFIKTKLKHQFARSLRLFISGGARLEPKVARDLTKFNFKIIEGYGLTETSPVVTLNPPQRIKFGSVGKPLPDVKIKILNPDNFGVGQILIKGPNVMKGYFKQEELASSIIKEGWFYSGDLGYIDKDGYLFITGREKEIIVLSSGKNIYPEELEAYYSQSHYIKEICILGISQERFGHSIETLYAVVVPDLEYFRQKNEANIQGKIRWELENLAKTLPSYKHIMGFVITKEELPRTPLKKIKRYEVREKCLQGRFSEPKAKENIFSQDDLETLNGDIATQIIHYVSSQLKKPVYLDSHLEIDLGIDSLTRVELGLGLEALFGIKIPDDALYTVSTIKEVIIKLMGIIENKTQMPMHKNEGVEKDWNQILKEVPEKQILGKVRIEPYFLDKLFVAIFKNIFLFTFRLFWCLIIKGRDSLPKEGPYILCPNHASYLDGFVVSSSLTLNQTMNVFFLGYSAIFKHPLVKWVTKSTRLVPIDPNVHLSEAMQIVSFVLAHKKIVCIFPEGGRSIGEEVKEFKKGIGILIKELDIPAVPVYIRGSHQSWPRGSLLPRLYPLKIIFGRPFSGKELMKEKNQIGDDYAAIAQGLREEVLKLAKIC